MLRAYAAHTARDMGGSPRTRRYVRPRQSRPADISVRVSDSPSLSLTLSPTKSPHLLTRLTESFVLPTLPQMPNQPKRLKLWKLYRDSLSTDNPWELLSIALLRFPTSLSAIRFSAACNSCLARFFRLDKHALESALRWSYNHVHATAILLISRTGITGST